MRASPHASLKGKTPYEILLEKLQSNPTSTEVMSSAICGSMTGLYIAYASLLAERDLRNLAGLDVCADCPPLWSPHALGLCGRSEPGEGRISPSDPYGFGGTGANLRQTRSVLCNPL